MASTLKANPGECGLNVAGYGPVEADRAMF